MARWREQWPSVRLVYATLPVHSPERLMARLAAAGVDAVNVHHRAVSPRVVAAARRHERIVLAWGVRRRVSVSSVLARGADGVFADDAEALAAALAPSTRRLDSADGLSV